MKENISALLENKKSLLDLINSMLKPKEIEKKKNGEVFTPLNVVEEMLNTLPIEVWSNPKLKWLDPAVGIGNFMVCVYYRLMEGLKSVIPEESKRKQHILEHMLYMSELNSKNVFICRTIFGEKSNLYEGDTLQMNKWNDFDIVIGNPPYQDSGATGDNKLYLSFIQYSIDKLKQNGYLLFIVPTNVKNYLTGVNKNRDYITELYQLHTLTLNVANSYFSVGSTFAYFLLQKNPVESCLTKVEYVRNDVVEKDTILIEKGMNLPLCLSKTDMVILNKVSNLMKNEHEVFPIQKAEYVTDGKISQQRIRKQHIDKGIVKEKATKEFCYKIINKITKTKPFPGEVYYNDRKMEDYGKPKIVMCTGGYLMPSYDEKGTYNLSDNMIYMLCNSEKEFTGLKLLSESPLVQYLNTITMTDGLHGRDNVMKNLKKIDLTTIATNEDVYKAYELTNDEIELIEKTI